MAAYSNVASFFDSNASTSIANIAPLTPNIGDLAIVFVGTTGYNSPASLVTDDNAGGSGYALIGSALRTASADVFTCFIRNAALAAATPTTFTATIGVNTGAFIVIVTVSGMPRFGASAIRFVSAQQFVKLDNQTGSIPSMSYSAVPLAANFQVTCVNATINPPNGSMGGGLFVQRLNSGYNSPAAGFQVFTVDSGDTSIPLPWVSSLASYASMALELDTSPDAGAAAATTPFPPLGRGATW